MKVMAKKSVKIKLDPRQLNDLAAQARIWITALRLALNGARGIMAEKQKKQ